MLIDTCPNCGAEVPRHARACPACGADDQTGWSEGAQASGLDLPDPEFNYDDFVNREFGGRKPVPRGIPWFWWLVAVLVLLMFLAFVIR